MTLVLTAAPAGAQPRLLDVVDRAARRAAAVPGALVASARRGEGRRLQAATARAVGVTTATALAAAIAASRDHHLRHARPIPAAVRRALAGRFPAALLASARYAVGGRGVSLPTLINGGLQFFGETHAHAVTVGDVIVFSRDPGMRLAWWAHELHHVAQYRQWGVDGFARRYVADWRAVEADAASRAGQVR